MKRLLVLLLVFVIVTITFSLASSRSQRRVIVVFKDKFDERLVRSYGIGEFKKLKIINAFSTIMGESTMKK